MQQFARARRMVSMIAKVLWQDDVVWHDFAHLLTIVIQPGLVGSSSGKDRRTTRIARRRGAVSVGEENSTGRQSIQIRRDRLWMPAQTADPIVQIIHGDEEHVGLRWLLRLLGKCG